MPDKRFKLSIWHGEHHSLYYICDTYTDSIVETYTDFTDELLQECNALNALTQVESKYCAYCGRFMAFNGITKSGIPCYVCVNNRCRDYKNNVMIPNPAASVLVEQLLRACKQTWR